MGRERERGPGGHPGTISWELSPSLVIAQGMDLKARGNRIAKEGF